MPNLPIKYRKSAEAVASYPYSDIKDGTGYTIFYGLQTQVDSTAANDEYILSTSQIVSSAATTDMSAGGNKDFDVVFASSKIIDGYLYFNFCAKGGEGAGQSVTPSIEVIHYDGSTETTIGTATNFQAIGQNVYKQVSGKLYLTRTKFKQGEILRISVGLTAATVPRLYHDPVGVVDAVNFPQLGGAMKFYVPFIIDL